jgi:ABC-type glutathione transport system ATPase component
MDTILDLRDKGYTIIIISHDINLVKNNADMIFAMDSGTLVEKWNPTTKPVEPATNKLLMDSDEVNSSLKGIIPD